ncbi:hypothetical protein BATDEDRAFT_89862 [Batrachochytrium dendrobatidis JAM81]|uniref:Uncharacterized protein n=1 Tax=Batrachochytrium dendrobatidis (strain JAM81 / FGSC 10211) TaxID=684364 RepID=F4P5F1_BATDJ|nr:uncharacterized protein BATDEDRAFT_89862 [Batrachochytrium dendrobatidis JAM81]EGF79182.1 hypothetical protein BATDEDRAFT_89862 [Batrachochytrium dendrobatidis JAM81]|eukprot:XP_006680045.1 hypothetical protein BATDEDRAFT_89862 [Batrachochytrium dendrobatidis JAM81]
MKLAVAVLSSILLALSVTTANPVNPSATTDVETSTSTVIPSATTSTEASTSSTPNPNGIGLGALDTLPGNVKYLLERYVKLDHNRNHHEKICDSLKSEYEDQKKLVTDLGTKLYILKRKSQTSGGSPEYDGEIQETKIDLEAQRSKLFDIRSRYMECRLKNDCFENAIGFIKMSLADLIFGGNWDSELFDQQFDLINAHPSVKGYLDKLSLEYSEILGQSPSDQQCQESQSPLDTPSGSGSSEQEAPPNKRKRVSKLVDELKSFFKRPKHDDPSV